MKKWKFILLSAIVSTAFLAACNKDEDKTSSNTEPNKETSENTNKSLEKNITLTFNKDGQPIEENALFTNSDNQPFSIYVLDKFGLTAEEPNRDDVYLKENDAVFMRIETLSDDDGDYELVYDIVKETAYAVGIAKPPVEIENADDLPQGDGIERAAGFVVETNLGNVTSYVFMRDNYIVRATIFDRHEYNVTNELKAMLETITLK